MSKFWMGLALAGVFATGCTDKDPDTGDTSSEEEGGEEGADPDPTFTVTWTDAGDADTITVAGTDCSDCDGFGIAEKNAACEAAEYGCWTAEDCVYGYESPVSDNSWGPVCHGWDGSSLTLTQTADADAVTDSAGLTIFSSEFAGLVSYYVENAAGDCWIGGFDESYYTGLSCTSASFTEN